MISIAQRFDAAAAEYDQAANVQAQVAAHLVDWENVAAKPQHILDVGSGTGFVVQELARKYPAATLTALDHAPSMLRQAQRKLPGLHMIIGDASRVDLDQKFDAIYSSMMLHWLPHPVEVLRRWQRWLKPEGRLYVALLTEGSFQEWRDLCRDNNVADGLWPMPRADFANDIATRIQQQTLTVEYSSAHEFLQSLKMIGAATPRYDHAPVSVSVMRHLLRRAPQPFKISHEILYIEMQSPGSV